MMQKDEVMSIKKVVTIMSRQKPQPLCPAMVLHGGQANFTKDESSQMSQFMSSRPWSQFGTGASCGGSGSCGSGSGSSASSTPAVVTSSSALPKAICDAPVKLSWASVQHDIKETKVVQERLGRDKKDQNQ